MFSIPRRRDAISLAKQLLDTADSEIVDLVVHGFDDDFQAHDDDLQNALTDTFIREWNSAKDELSEEFGEPIEQGSGTTNDVPLNGILRFAKWKQGCRVLYLAASHEDRECHYLLMLGTTASYPAQT